MKQLLECTAPVPATGHPVTGSQMSSNVMARASLLGRSVAVTGRTPAATKAVLSRGGNARGAETKRMAEDARAIPTMLMENIMSITSAHYCLCSGKI